MSEPFVVAEIGVNWLGNRIKLHDMIASCIDAGADAVKLQAFRHEHVKDHPRSYELTATSAFPSLIQRMNWIYEGYTDVFCSIFEPYMIPRYRDMPYLKIRQSDVDSPDWKGFFDYTGKFQKTFASTLHARTPKKIGDSTVTYLYCVPDYPTNPEDIDYDIMERLDGFSCHCPQVDIFERVKQTDPEVVECHVGVEDDMPDKGVSFSFDEFSEVIDILKEDDNGN